MYVFGILFLFLVSFSLFASNLFPLEIVSPSDAYLANLKTFSTEYQNEIKEIHDRINASMCEDWTIESDPYAVDFQPYEQISTLRMLSETDNVVLEKIMKVFVDLCFETDDLERIVCTF